MARAKDRATAMAAATDRDRDAARDKARDSGAGSGARKALVTRRAPSLAPAAKARNRPPANVKPPKRESMSAAASVSVPQTPATGRAEIVSTSAIVRKTAKRTRRVTVRAQDRATVRARLATAADPDGVVVGTAATVARATASPATALRVAGARVRDMENRVTPVRATVRDAEPAPVTPNRATTALADRSPVITTISFQAVRGVKVRVGDAKASHANGRGLRRL